MITRILWDIQHNQQAEIVNATNNSFEVLLKAVKKSGITCTGWFENTADWKDGSTPFNRRFNWRVIHESTSLA